MQLLILQVNQSDTLRGSFVSRARDHARRAKHHNPFTTAPPLQPHLLPVGLRSTRAALPRSEQFHSLGREHRAYDPALKRNSQGNRMLRFDGSVPVALMCGGMLQR
jgi:hypothetical protein